MKFSLIKNDIFSKKNLFNIFLWMNANILDQDIKTTTWTYSSITKILLLSVGDRHVWVETHQRPTCLFGDRQASLETHWTGMSVSNQACWSFMRHVGLRWVMSGSDEVCQSRMRNDGFRSDMSVSNGSLVARVHDRYPIIFFESLIIPNKSFLLK